MKRLLGVLFFLVLSVFLIGPDKSANAAYGSDNKTYAPLITSGNPIQDTLESYSDELYYRFEIKETRKVRLAINNIEDVELVGEIVDGNDNGYAKVITDEKSLVGQSATEVGLKKGTYYVKITSDTYFYNENYPVKFTLTDTGIGTYEIENNDSPNTATPIVLNKQYTGSIQWSYGQDTDYYKFELTKAGKVNIALSRVPGTQWNLEVFSELNKEYAYDQFTTNGNEFASGVESVDIGLPKGKYYIKVSSEKNTFNVPYKLKVTYKSTDSFETEYNDTIPTAMPIKLNKTYSAVINNSSDNDTDVFKFNVPSSGNVKFTMTQLAGVRWNVYIYNTAGTELLDFSTDSSNAAAKYLTQTKYLSKGTYYFYVSRQYSWDDSALWKPYSFSISQQTPTPKKSNVVIKNNKGKNDTITVKGLKKGSVVRVYNAKKSKVLVKGTSKGSSLTLSYKQLGTKAGKVYVSVQNPGYTQSSKVAVPFKGEQSAALKATNVKITNNKNKKDVVKVTGLAKGDVVKVYNAKGKKIATSKKSTGKSVTISIKQLGKNGGKVYVTVTKSGMTESKRITKNFSKEK